MRRRSIIIPLFVEDSRPENRKVSRAINEEYVIGRRSEILAALWAVVRYWRDEGHFYRGKENRSFGAWREIVGGITEFITAGIAKAPAPPRVWFAIAASPLDASPISHDERMQVWEKFLSYFVTKRADLLNEELKFADFLQIARESGYFSFLAEKSDNLKADDQKREDSILSKRFCQRFRNQRFDLAGRSIWFNDNGELYRAKRYTVSTEPPRSATDDDIDYPAPSQ